MIATIEIPSEDDLQTFAQRLAAAIQPGMVFGLVGQLGAGKTRLVQEVAVALGCAREGVNSPTFTLIHEYSGDLVLRHCDAYRVKNGDEFFDLGLDELFDPEGVAFIEWADRVVEYLPRNAIQISIEVTGPTSRRFVITASDRFVLQLTKP